VATLAACGGGEDADAAATPATTASDAIVRAVRTTTVARDALVAVRSASVTVRPSQESRVASGASGRVLAVVAREGAQVAAGDPLVRLDADVATANVDAAELAVAQARINLDRARRSSDDVVAQAEVAARSAAQTLANVDRQLAELEALLAVGAVAASDVDALRTQRAQAEAADLQARDAVARAGRAETEDLALLGLQVEQAQLQLRTAREQLTETTVRAPFDGEVAQTFVEEGEFAGAGSPVVRLTGVGPQVASFTVPPEDAPFLEGLGRVELTTTSGTVGATITRLERLAEQARLVAVLAQLDADAPRLPSGTLAEVRYAVPLGEGLLVPSGALAADAGRSYVYVVADVEGGQAARRVEVRVVAEAGNQAVIEALDGAALAPGRLVITPRPLDVRDGTAVRVIGE
ncbi:MAG: efflux RND transporter periplasmic adaptor subunit, partial [Trueperaceae bacterium]|nr:efflux RND transporter periplasmic adaptor subunit [Trueperaceae bacterium]